MKIINKTSNSQICKMRDDFVRSVNSVRFTNWLTVTSRLKVVAIATAIFTVAACGVVARACFELGIDVALSCCLFVMTFIVSAVGFFATLYTEFIIASHRLGTIADDLLSTNNDASLASKLAQAYCSIFGFGELLLSASFAYSKEYVEQLIAYYKDKSRLLDCDVVSAMVECDSVVSYCFKDSEGLLRKRYITVNNVQSVFDISEPELIIEDTEFVLRVPNNGRLQKGDKYVLA